MRITTFSLVACVLLAAVASTSAQTVASFESPQSHPVELTPDGARLLVCNTADNRLEVFNVTPTGLTWSGSIGTGLEPVSVRARSSVEAWVCNHLSDSVSVVNLATMTLSATLQTGDEPADVVFAGSAGRAFVSVSQLNRIEVFQSTNLSAAPTIIALAGEDPRALATDGTRVWCAIFESGNDTTAISEITVSTTVNPYAGDPNPPPNSGTTFSPAMAAGLPTPPKSSIIVRKGTDGKWRDVNQKDWSAAVTWGLHGNDIAQIDGNTLAVTYKKGFMTTNMAIAATASGTAVVVGTEAKNEIRFEPNVKSIFLRVEGALFSAGSTTPTTKTDLNPHLTYATASVPMATRMLSIGDPRGVAFSSDGTKVYVTGMGSDNLIVANAASLARVALAATGEGPTGIAVDASRSRIYVLNRFEGTVSVIDENTLVETQAAAFFDPTPTVVKAGRPFLYDTHLFSGLGQTSCGSCHIDGRMDQLSWDLGNPQGIVGNNNESCNLELPVGTCEDFHPMKGPMNTQTLLGLAGAEPFHWRGDRADFGQFAHAAVELLGGDSDFTAKEMAKFALFLEAIHFPPNPNRNLDGSLKTSLENGNPVTGLDLYQTGNLDFVQCVTCHTLPTGGLGTIISASLLQEAQSMKVPQLRNMYEKAGMDKTSQNNNRGFGFVHDGSTDTLVNFLSLTVFNFAAGTAGQQQRRDVTAFLLSFDTGTHASVGAQATKGGAVDQAARRAQLIAIATAGSSQLIARGVFSGEQRSFLFTAPSTFQSDRANETRTLAQLDAQSSASNPFTYTLVMNGTAIRTALDRDGDGFYDRDEVDQCADPADPTSTPATGGGCPDVDGNGAVDGLDLALLLSNWGGSAAADFDCSGTVDGSDLTALLGGWGACP
ncbi:MAG: hypothetical protein O2800_00990 [Planctomycetota bacterium]|nr:hypothetical protein [Planctomycetota bacterium]